MAMIETINPASRKSINPWNFYPDPSWGKTSTTVSMFSANDDITGRKLRDSSVCLDISPSRSRKS